MTTRENILRNQADRLEDQQRLIERRVNSRAAIADTNGRISLTGGDRFTPDTSPQTVLVPGSPVAYQNGVAMGLTPFPEVVDSPPSFNQVEELDVVIAEPTDRLYTLIAHNHYRVLIDTIEDNRDQLGDNFEVTFKRFNDAFPDGEDVDEGRILEIGDRFKVELSGVEPDEGVDEYVLSIRLVRTAFNG